MAKLIQQAERGLVVHELLFGSTSIGRGWLNDVVIADPGERRRHAEVVALGGGGYAVRDLGSHTGVRVNGEAVGGQRLLADGDVVEMGGVEFALDLAEPEAAPEEAEAEPRRRKGLLGGVVRLTLGTLLSRGFGLAREMVGMAYFGASGVFDAYVAATTLPNLFRDVLGEHAAEGAFMPAHKTLRGRGREAEARRLFTSVVWFVLLTGLWLVLLCGVFAPHLTALVVPGFVTRHPELWGKTVSLAQLMMPYLVIIALAAVFGGLLLGDRRFVRYAVAPAGSSVCVILAVVVLSGRLGVWSLAVGLLAGGTVQMLICAMPYLRRWRALVTWERPRIDPSQPALRKVARSVVPIGLAGLLNKLIWIVDRALASWFCFPGAISALYAAHRLLQLPHGVVGLAVGRAAFPSLVEQASSREGRGFSRAVVGALRLNVFLTLPAMVALVVLSRPLVRLMYERGAFTAEHTGWVTLAVVCYGVGLVGMGARTVMSRAFYSLLNTRTPFFTSAVAVGTNVVLSVALVLTPLDHGGLALASSLATWLQVGLLVWLLGGEVRKHGRELSLEGIGPALARMAVSGVLMAAAAWGALAVLPAGRGLLWKVVTLVVPGVVGAGVYFATALVLGAEELAQLRRRLRRGRKAGDNASSQEGGESQR